ncbi:MAG: S-adenosylmethionine:tRNA ribosyltransferase-isomerase [Bacteroidales bacterium]|nr:S-adenosylmethionine:tRNA ribosyltransferase-isomerase [Bacteroidales bacterium]
MIPDIRIEDYSYDLPDERIAKYPLERRDASKLLIYKDGRCSDDIFRNLPDYLPEHSIMVVNDTKVVPARLFFRRQSGAHIEIFCLQPVEPAEYVKAFDATGACKWQCVIGNSKRWKDDTLYYDTEDPELRGVNLRARLISREGQTGVVEFVWDGSKSFSEVLDLCGRVPIPPYLNRETEAIDLERYQTTYAHIRGSVAAPTAGLHFTPETLAAIAKRHIETDNVCLHVGAGTFLPVKSSRVSEHPMHREPFIVKRSLLERLAGRDCTLTAVGTTSVRTLESLYYAGASCIEKGKPEDVGQWDPYTREWPYETEETLRALISYLDANGLDELKIGTRIIIVPGFRFRIVDRLVTNFHQPQSTLLLLISAFVGGDWHTIYDYALENGFRFLSYGDSSLLFRR